MHQSSKSSSNQRDHAQHTYSCTEVFRNESAVRLEIFTGTVYLYTKSYLCHTWHLNLRLRQPTDVAGLLGGVVPILLSAAMSRPSVACPICCLCYAPVDSQPPPFITVRTARVQVTATRGDTKQHLITSTPLTRARGSLYERRAVQGQVLIRDMPA